MKETKKRKIDLIVIITFVFLFRFISFFVFFNEKFKTTREGNKKIFLSPCSVLGVCVCGQEGGKKTNMFLVDFFFFKYFSCVFFVCVWGYIYIVRWCTSAAVRNADLYLAFSPGLFCL